MPFYDTNDKSHWFYVKNFEYRKNIPLLNADDINKYTRLFLALRTLHEEILDDADGDWSEEQLSRRVRGKEAIFEALGDNDPEVALTEAGVKGLEARGNFLLSKGFGKVLAKYHQNGIGPLEIKYVHLKNGAEIVLDGKDGKVVTDPRWRGTFNYGVAAGGIDHRLKDIIPWVEFGTGTNDTIPYEEKVELVSSYLSKLELIGYEKQHNIKR